MALLALLGSGTVVVHLSVVLVVLPLTAGCWTQEAHWLLAAGRWLLDRWVVLAVLPLAPHLAVRHCQVVVVSCPGGGARWWCQVVVVSFPPHSHHLFLWPVVQA